MTAFLLLLALAACDATTEFRGTPLPDGNASPSGSADDGDTDDEDDDSGSGSAGGAGSGDTVSFVAFGDWGTGGDDQEAVAQAIGDYCATEECEFIVTLGDNFYSDGVDSVDDELWQDYYHDVYDFLGLPFYPVVGNHDNDGTPQAEVEYSQIDPNWRMAAIDYNFTAPEGATTPLLEFFLFDSEYPHFRYDGDDEAEDGYDAPTWMYDGVTTSTATWKAMVMHHPLYNNGNHGSDGEDNIPVLLGEDPVGKPNILCDGTQSRFDLILSGHAHSFSHIRTSMDGCEVEQLVIGTGGADLKTVNATLEGAEVLATGGDAEDLYGFGWFQVTEDEALFRFITTDGTVFYETTFTK
ncbi:MAG: metallophosphoesterase [Deltaproteobacteria bacterium]|nr:metallophosphoesterase [Deltaproteobacteria bacterium]